MTPWGDGRWGAHPTDADSIFANFVGQEHAVRVGKCWSLSSTRKSDGDKASAGALLGKPPTACAELQPRADREHALRGS